MESSLGATIEHSISNHWDLQAFSNTEGQGSYRYSDVATLIARYHHSWRKAGFEPGFRVAICGRNSSEWCISFLAALTYGAVLVPLLNEFTPEMVHRLVEHSESKILVVGRHIWKNLDVTQMPNLVAIFSDDDQHELLYSADASFGPLIQQADAEFDSQHPQGVTREDLHYFHHEPEDLIMINYTSGTTSAPKGVMIPERALWSNMDFAETVLPNLHPGMDVVSMLPTAHLYGMSFEFMYEFIIGIHIHFINRALTPTVIANALSEIKPDLIVVVPMIIEKVVKKKIMPIWNSPKMQFLRKIPLVRDLIFRKIRQGLYEGLGGKFYEVIIGGSALNKDVEKILHKVKFPYTVGYGMTECAPIIGYCDWHNYAPYSCGRPAPRMEVKILSEDQHNIPGEIVTRGMNVMLGYYKNEEATAAAIDQDGWLHTGDMGVMDHKGNIYIRGRIKNMLLSASGQNVYPEEIETQLNALPLVAESVVVQREHRLIGLVFPDAAEAKLQQLDTEDQILAALGQSLPKVNAKFPAYSQVSAIELVEQEFEKTPKKSIKRFLYT